MTENTQVEVVMDVEAPAPELTLAVTIPENSSAGDKITIKCPDNNYVQFVTPENVVPGDTVHVTVSESTDGNETSSETHNEVKPAGTSYQGVAAVTTGVLVSSLLIGPVVTGVLVVGIVVCAAQRKNPKAATPVTESTEADTMEAASSSEATDSNECKPTAISSEPETREQKIAAALVKTAEYIVDKWSAIDERFAISGNTLKAIATVQEMDERNKISETVVTSIKSFDEKYQVTETAGNAVAVTVTKVKELDESCKLTENVTNAGSNLALCMTDFERRYDITTRITTALIYSVTTLSEALTVYMNRIAYGSDASPDGIPTGAVPMNLDIPMESTSIDPELASPDEHGSYQAPVAAV